MILPVEVKAGATGSMKSLHQFMGEKTQDLAVRFDAALPEDFSIATKVVTGTATKEVKYRMLSLPLYLVEKLEDIVMEAL